LRISANELSDMLIEIITKQAQVVLNIDQLRDVGKIDARLVRQAGHDKQIAALNDSKRRLYERLTLGELDIEAYKTEKAPLDAELARLGQVNAALVSELAEQAKDATRQKLAAQASAENGLTRALVDLLIDKVLVFPDNRLEIKWKVKDFFDTDDGGFENVG
jgi:hypothetical protein